MIRNNFINPSTNYVVNFSFANKNSLAECSSDNLVEEQINIDTEVPMLSSRKLWQILKLNHIKGCELDKEFVQQVKNELIARNDFDKDSSWNEPH